VEKIHIKIPKEQIIKIDKAARRQVQIENGGGYQCPHKVHQKQSNKYSCRGNMAKRIIEEQIEETDEDVCNFSSIEREIRRMDNPTDIRIFHIISPKETNEVIFITSPTPGPVRESVLRELIQRTKDLSAKEQESEMRINGQIFIAFKNKEIIEYTRPAWRNNPYYGTD
jgi:hypothetical protein